MVPSKSFVSIGVKHVYSKYLTMYYFLETVHRGLTMKSLVMTTCKGKANPLGCGLSRQ